MREILAAFALLYYTYELVVVWLADGVRSIRIALVWASPQVQLVLGDSGETACLVCGGIVAGHVQPG